MLLANESLLMLVALVGISGIVVLAIGNNYTSTIQSINTISDSRNAQSLEDIEIIDVQKNDSTIYAIISNRSAAVTFTEFWDESGRDVVCSDGAGTLDILEMPAYSTITISCISDSDVILLTSNYNIIRIVS